jgi:hypothetical protein
MENTENQEQQEQQKTDSKQISIVGTNNRYQMKKVTKQKTEIKKRVESEKWTFSDEYYQHDKQLELLNTVLRNIRNSSEKSSDDVIKIIIQQIHNKITGYKQQDTLKKMFDEEIFLTFENVIERLVDCEIKCYYCKKEMMVLYDISREMTQWSIDRIDNDTGHNIDNYHLSCLDCNLKRRRRTDEKFRFTKQLNLIKQEQSD